MVNSIKTVGKTISHSQNEKEIRQVQDMTENTRAKMDKMRHIKAYAMAKTNNTERVLMA